MERSHTCRRPRLISSLYDVLARALDILTCLLDRTDDSLGHSLGRAGYVIANSKRVSAWVVRVRCLEGIEHLGGTLTDIKDTTTDILHLLPSCVSNFNRSILASSQSVG